MVFGARLLQKPAMLVTSREGEVEASIRDFVLTYFLLSELISSWNPSVFLSTSQGFHSDWKTWKNGKAFSS